MSTLSFGEVFQGARVRAISPVRNNLGEVYPEGAEFVVMDKHGDTSGRHLQAVLLSPLAWEGEDRETWFYFNSQSVLGMEQVAGKLELAE
jgi:hypothetical protein